MLDKVLNVIFSTRLTAVLLFIFAAAIGIATFIESAYDTTAAKVAVFNAKWFEYVLLLLLMNLIGNIVKFKMFRKEKITVLMFHLSFIIIILGAGITRYTGFEGMMKIREGEESNQIVSEETYLQIKIDNQEKQKPYLFKVMPNEFIPGYFKKDLEFLGTEFDLHYKGFIKNAIDTLIDQKNDKRILEIVTVGHNGRQSIFIEEGTTELVGKYPVSFNDPRYDAAIKLAYTDSGMVVMSPYEIQYMTMQSREEGSLRKDTIVSFPQGRLYTVGQTQMVYKDLYRDKAVVQISAPKDNKNGTDLMLVDLSSGGETKELKLFGGKGYTTNKTYMALNKLNVTASYGSIEIPVPFKIGLNDFRLQRYPGTQNPSSFESDVVLIDERDGTFREQTIFMNNVMDYDGYRFFQSSYDEDELGTILSVNHDFWGTWITYVGYFFMMLGFILTLMVKKTRFHSLRKKLEKLRAATPAVIMLLSVLAFSNTNLKAQDSTDTTSQIANEIVQNSDAEKEFKVVDKAHADRFARLLVQADDGRIEPMQTMAFEFLRKVNRSKTFMGQSPEQVVLGMIAFPEQWREVPLIHIGMDAKSLREELNAEGKKATFLSFINDQGGYLLSDAFDEAFRKPEKERSKYEKEILKITDRVNLCLEVFNDGRLKMFPIKDDPNRKWYRPIDMIEAKNIQGSELLWNAYKWYRESLINSVNENNYAAADSVIVSLKAIQRNAGGDLIISDRAVDLEIKYNKYDVNNNLFYLYSLLGVALLILLIAEIIRGKSSTPITRLIKFIIYMLIIGTILHGVSLGIRWYLSGHAPWSNAYEAVVYIAFMTMVAGFIFSKKSKMTLAATSVLAGLTMFVAGLNFMDPDIGTLVPVLKSYWLMIHVAIITASYAFLGLAAILGIVNMILYLIRNPENNKRITRAINELTVNSELTMTVGLFMAATGTFLGGIWANESWGRYWGWDSKETWALVIVLIYAMILHLRLIPKANGKFLFNIVSILGYSTVLMTFFGVNYYLSGLHSYAGGDTPETPVWIWPTIASLFLLMILAGIAKNKFEDKMKRLKSDRLIADK